MTAAVEMLDKRTRAAKAVRRYGSILGTAEAVPIVRQSIPNFCWVSEDFCDAQNGHLKSNLDRSE